MFSLRPKNDENFQSERIAFFEGLLLYLQSGYDPAFAWDRMARLSWSERLSLAVFRSDEESVVSVWERLVRHPDFAGLGLWFRAMRNLYLAGGSLSPVVEAFATAQKKERERRVKRFAETLPTRMNVCLILFFLPPIFLLLFHPLLSEIIDIF